MKDQLFGAVAKGNGQGLRVSDAAISDNKSFVVTNESLTLVLVLLLLDVDWMYEEISK